MRVLSAGLLAFLVFGSVGCPGNKSGGGDDDDDDDGTSATPTPTGPVVTVDGDVTTFDWGTQDVPVSGSETFTFTAPAGTIGIELISIGGAGDRDVYLAFEDVVAPGSRVVIDGTGNGPARQWFGNVVNCLGIPADDDPITAVASGEWSFQVGAWNPANDNALPAAPAILAKVRTGGAIPAGAIDLNVIVVAGLSFTATDLMNGTGAAGTEFQAALAHMDTLYASAGLAVGDIAWIDLPSSASYGTISDRVEAEDLFMLSSTFTERRVNVFVVAGFDGQLNGVFGTSGGIPEPARINGSADSGTAITLRGSGTSTGEFLAHEIGHALGAYHTSEFSGTVFDPISDTPECPNIPTSCPDAGNVMYPMINGSYAGFSAGQTTVLKPVPHVRASTALALRVAPFWEPPGRVIPALACDGGAARAID